MEDKANFYQDLANQNHENAKLNIAFTLEDDVLKPGQ
jgi:hypothetical protein|nr:MAG TPA: hypothetical protein [Caudoviricetes sp.]